MKRTLVAFAALALTWLVLQPTAPPLYDGLGFPDEAYRYVSPPKGYEKTPKPDTATATWDAATDPQGGLIAFTSEVGPQAAVQVLGKDVVDADGQTVTLKLTPEAPTTQPTDGAIWGNVYNLTLTTPTGKPSLALTPNSAIRLRAPNGKQPTVAIEFNDGSGWEVLTTFKSGTDVYDARGLRLGRYAIVRLGAKAPKVEEARSSTGLILGIVGGTLVLVIAGQQFIRRKRSRTR